jgi:hypothetical protein
MTELTASHFADICRQGPVAIQIRTIEETRRAAMRRFWLTLGFGLLLAAGLASAAASSAGIEIGAMVGIGLLVVTVVSAAIPLGNAAEGIKHPVLEAVAAQAGMSFIPAGFDPPVFGAAYRPLFGSWISSSAFTDLFHGADSEGRNFAFYEATLTRGHGKHRHTAFSGQVYAFQRRRRGHSEAVAVPDRGLFNFFKPSGGFERVRTEQDPDFDRKFEVYATHPAEAAMLFGSSAVRRTLLGLRDGGRVFAYVGPEDVLVAVTAPNRFEPGCMLRSRSGEQRVRLMFDDVCASLKVLETLRVAIG